MAASLALTVRSTLGASPEAVWAHAVQLERVMDETGVIDLRAPFGYERLGPAWLATHEPALVATVWLFGLIPVDRWAMRLEHLSNGRFVERSQTLWFSHWRHERVVESHEDGCHVVDRVVCAPRIPGATVVMLPLLARLFERRHHHLRRMFGTSERHAPRAERTLGAGAEQEAALAVGGAVALATVVGVLAAWALSRRSR